MSQQALDGVRVLDFTRVLAGPLCTMILADLGAEVIKVENPSHGDDTRQWGPPYQGTMSAYFASVNRNKKSLTLNLKSEEGIAIAKQLAKQSDVVIENFKIGQMASFGLSYEDLRNLNPKLVYCSITGFGQNGTLSKYPGYDYAIQAMSGLMSITGEAQGEPHKVGVATSDIYAGMFANSAILAALRHAEHTGEGQYIDIALFDAQIAALVNITSNYLVSGENPPRYGNQHPNIVPYQTFHASDKQFVLACGNDRQFRLLAHLIQMPHLLEDDRFATNPQRVKHRAEVESVLQDVFITKSADEWVSLLLDAGIPAGAINTVAEALEMPQIQERNLIYQATRSTGDVLKMIASPINMSQTPPQMQSAPPELGEHTQAILREHLQFSPEKIEELHNNQVI